MLHPSTKKLIDRLSEMTVQRKIDWMQTDRPDAFVYDTDAYRVVLDGKPAALVLCDALGNELDRADPDELAGTKHIDGGTYTEIVAAMRSDASRIARGTENAIAAVLGGLDLDGDGIPDIPAPTELEAAPEGDAGEALDNVEDTVNEADAIEAVDIDSMADIEAPLDTAEMAEAATDMLPDGVDLPDAVTDIEEALSDQVDELAMPDVDVSSTLGAAAASLGSDLNIDEIETPTVPDMQDLAGQAQGLVDKALPDVDLDAAPEDVGQAVADLADKVNGDAEADASSGPSIGLATSLLTGAGAMGAFAAMSGNSQGTIETEPSARAPDVAEEIEPEPPIAPETVAMDAAPDEQEPIKTISLSGLTAEAAVLPTALNGDTAPMAPEVPAAEEAPAVEEVPEVPAELTRAATIVTDVAEPSAADVSEDIEAKISDLTDQITAPLEDAPVEAADTEPEMQLVAEADADDIEAPAAPEAPAEDVSDEEPAQPAAPKRFNPWI